MLFMSSGAQCMEWDATLETGAGVDDNVARTSLGTTSAFCMVGGQGEVHFQSGGRTPLMTTAYFFGRYQDFWDAEENHHLGIGADFSVSLMDGALVPGLVLEGSRVREGDRPDEDRNAFRLAGSLRWLAGARVVLTVRETWSRRFYDEVLPADTDPTVNGTGRGKGRGDGTRFQDADRQDDLLVTELTVSVYPAPAWEAELTGTHFHNDSTLTLESYAESGGRLKITWGPSPSWTFFVEGGWWRADYDTAGRRPSRTDDRLRGGLGVARGFSSWELFVDAVYEDNDSTWTMQTYRDTVTRCGIRWFF